MIFLTRRLVKLTPNEIDTLLKADTILSDIKTKMRSDMIDRKPESITLNLYFDYDDKMPISYAEIADIDRILYALSNAGEIITELNNEGDENGQ